MPHIGKELALASHHPLESALHAVKSLEQTLFFVQLRRGVSRRFRRPVAELHCEPLDGADENGRNTASEEVGDCNTECTECKHVKRELEHFRFRASRVVLDEEGTATRGQHCDVHLAVVDPAPMHSLAHALKVARQWPRQHFARGIHEPSVQRRSRIEQWGIVESIQVAAVDECREAPGLRQYPGIGQIVLLLVQRNNRKHTQHTNEQGDERHERKGHPGAQTQTAADSHRSR